MPCDFGFGQHRPHILDAAVDIERYRTGIAAFEHRGDARRPHFGDGGGAGGVAQEIHQPFRATGSACVSASASPSACQ